MVTNMNGAVVHVGIPPIHFYEFQMNRRQNCRLRELGQNEKDFNFVHFMGMGFDQFEYTSRNASNEVEVLDSAKLQSVTLNTCMQCHSGPGIFSVNSYTRFLSFFPNHRNVRPISPRSTSTAKSRTRFTGNNTSSTGVYCRDFGIKKTINEIHRNIRCRPRHRAAFENGAQFSN